MENDNNYRLSRWCDTITWIGGCYAQGVVCWKQTNARAVSEWSFCALMKVSATNQQAAVINFTEHCNWPALTFHLGPKRTHNTLAHICTPTSHRNIIIRLAPIYTITLAVYHTITVARYHTAWQPQRGHRHCHLQPYGAIKDHTAHVAFHSLT